MHLQINARVLTKGQWRGLHTVGVRDSIDAINGIGHAAMMTDPAFRQALAEHGFTLDPSSGEVVDFVEFVGPFSARAAQIARHLDTYEAQWRAANPYAKPGPGLRRAWDRRAWADAPPDKVAALRAEPTLRAHPDHVVDTARELWALNREQRASWLAVRAAAEHEADRAAASRSPGWDTVLEISSDDGGGVGGRGLTRKFPGRSVVPFAGPVGLASQHRRPIPR